jgi:hypothetical protein
VEHFFVKELFFDFTKTFALTAMIFLLGVAFPAFAALSCSVTTAAGCVGTVILRMSGSSNAHAELPNQTTAAYNNNVMCCTGVSGLGTSCSGSFGTVVKLASTTNSHIQQNSVGTYANNACISASTGSYTIGYQANDCSGFDTTLGSMAAADNSHVGNTGAYTTKICASYVVNSLTFITDASSETFPPQTPGALVATSSILIVSTTNATGFNITILRSTSAATMTLNTDSIVTIPDKADWIAPAATTTVGNATASTTQPNTLQFRVQQGGTDAPNYASSWWGSNDTTASALFGGIPSTTQTIINRSTSALSTTTAYILYNLNTPSTQKTGTYSGTMTYTATANP